MATRVIQFPPIVIGPPKHFVNEVARRFDPSERVKDLARAILSAAEDERVLALMQADED